MRFELALGSNSNHFNLKPLLSGMKRILPLCFAFAVSVLNAQTIDQWAVDGIVQFKIDADPGFDLLNYAGGNIALDLLVSTYGGTDISQPYALPGTSLDSVYRIEFTSISQVNALITALEALPFVEFAEKYPLCVTYNTPNDFASQQWYLSKINAELGWDYSTGNSNVLIAIIDNAVAIDHEDLNANIYTNTAEANGLPLIDDDLNGAVDDVNGYDVSNLDANPRPPAGQGNATSWVHGTHVAGLASAATNNGSGMAGLGYNCSILPVKCANDNSDGGSFDKVIDGVFYALRSGADVINMSFGTPSDNQVFKMMIQQAAASNIVLIAAAGNDNVNTPFYPAAYPECISVGATNENDIKASFSNFGTTVDVMAPGVNMYSTLLDASNPYGTLNGTSMAAPLVSGLAGLLLADQPQLTAPLVRNRILSSCDDISAVNPGLNGQLGAGRINAFKTLGNVGVDEMAQEVNVAYPNPVSGGILYVDREWLNHTFMLHDASGRTVLSGPATLSMDLSELPAGIYLLKVFADTGTITQRLMVP